jgi:ubiquinone biosynthesis protein UbiJ
VHSVCGDEAAQRMSKALRELLLIFEQPELEKELRQIVRQIASALGDAKKVTFPSMYGS